MKENNALVIATDFSDKRAVIASGHESKPGGKISYIEKVDGKWKLVQTIDLDDILIEHSPVFVVCNDQWMVLVGIPKDINDLAVILLFNRTEEKWNRYPTPEVLTGLRFSKQFYNGEPLKNIALSSDNQLYIGQSYDKNPAGKGKVLRFDLNSTPIEIKEILQPPSDSIVRNTNGGYGYGITVNDRFLVVMDICAAFSEEDIKFYGLTEDDITKRTSGGIPQPQNRASILVYQFNRDEDRWEYVTDLFKELPHPPGGILRGLVEYRSPNRKNVWHYSMIQPNFPCCITKNSMYLSTSYQYFVFKACNENLLIFEKEIIPHKLPSELKRNKVYTKHYVIGEKFSLYFHRDTGYFEIYRTDELEKWNALWKIEFDTVHCPRIAENARNKNYTWKFSIDQNSMLAYYMIRTHNPETHESHSTGRFYIYDIDENNGPKKTFSLRLNRNGTFFEEAQ